MIVYQVLPRLWGHGKMSDWDEAAFRYLKSLGVTHIWLTGIPRHASGEAFVKGDPGSPYSISDWFDINPYLADSPADRMSEFENLVKAVHLAGMAVITDFIPNHVARNYSGPVPVHSWCDYDWTDTLKIDYSSGKAVGALTDALEFWISKGVDGFRCDMVELVPREAMRTMISSVRSRHPEVIFIAEAYDRNSYRDYLENVGFDFLYDKSGSYDALISVMNGGDVRQLSWNWQFLGDMQPKMLNFLENHDERRLSSPDYAALAYSALFNRASFMLYFGQEIDERASDTDDGRTSIFNEVHLPSMRRLNNYIHTGKGLTTHELKTLCRHRQILSMASAVQSWENYDLHYCNCGPVFPFIRYESGSGGRVFLVVCNFSCTRQTGSIMIPEDAKKKCRLVGDSIPYEAEAHDCAVLPL